MYPYKDKASGRHHKSLNAKETRVSFEKHASEEHECTLQTNLTDWGYYISAAKKARYYTMSEFVFTGLVGWMAKRDLAFKDEPNKKTSPCHRPTST